jgi:hypothetical protein
MLIWQHAAERDAMKRVLVCAVLACATTAGMAAAPIMARGYAMPSVQQQQRLAQELDKAASDARLAPIVDEAGPAIASFVQHMACMMPGGSKAINAYAVPGQNLAMRLGQGPMGRTRYHDKTTCMSVTRIHGWGAPANNAVRFEVVYTADDSGEIATYPHEAVRQPDGVWLFRK